MISAAKRSEGSLWNIRNNQARLSERVGRMGYFDENEEKSVSDDITALVENSSKEEKLRRKEEKRLEKERKKQEKLERKQKMEMPEEEPEVTVRITPEESVVEPVKKKEDKKKGASDEKAEEIKETAAEGSAAGVIAEAMEAEASEEEESGRKKKKKKKKDEKVEPGEVNIVKDLLSLIVYIGIVILICFLIVTFVGRRTTVHGSSMQPTLQSGDSLWINMLAYKFGDPERYDIIVFPYEDDVHYIKRIIGLPGETVQITEYGEILINGQALVEPIKFEKIKDNGIAANPITLGKDEYFVLGDNRNNSRDSRWSDVGLIPRDKIIGKAVFRLMPFKNFGSIK